MRAVAILIAGLALGAAILAVRWSLERGRRPAGEAAVGAAPARGGGHRPLPRWGEERRSPLPRPLEPGQRVPDASLVDQEGRELKLSELRGNLVVLAFVYTHCNVPSMCPLATAKLVETARLVKERGIEEVRFLLVSFDMRRDRPGRLKEFAALYGADLARFTFASGDARDVAALSRSLSVFYRESSPGTFEHNIVVSLIDREGVLRDDFFGTGWEEDELVSAVEALAAKPRSVPSEP